MMLFTLIAYLELLYGRSKSLILKHSDTFIKFFNHLTLFLNRSKFLLWHQKFALSPNINMRSVSISDYGGVSRIETILPTSSVFTSQIFPLFLLFLAKNFLFSFFQLGDNESSNFWRDIFLALARVWVLSNFTIFFKENFSAPSVYYRSFGQMAGIIRWKFESSSFYQASF